MLDGRGLINLGQRFKGPSAAFRFPAQTVCYRHSCCTGMFFDNLIKFREANGLEVQILAVLHPLCKLLDCRLGILPKQKRNTQLCEFCSFEPALEKPQIDHRLSGSQLSSDQDNKHKKNIPRFLLIAPNRVFYYARWADGRGLINKCC